MRPIVAPGNIPLDAALRPVPLMCLGNDADGTIPMANEAPRNVLPDLSQQLAQMQAMIAAQAAEISRLSASRAANHKLRISEKGCVTLTGINGKWGVSFYATQWETILSKRDEILAFIAAHPELPRKTAD